MTVAGPVRHRLEHPRHRAASAGSGVDGPGVDGPGGDGPGVDGADAGVAPEKSLWHYLSVSVSAAVLLLVLALAVVTIALPALVGGRPMTVLTQSMEPGLPPGTLVVVKPIATDDIRIGDVLTYQIRSGEPAVVSHRVIEKTMASDGGVTFITKGDNNDVADEQPVQEVQIVGALWYSVPLLGWVNNAVNGEARAVVIPVAVAALFGYAGWMVLSSLLASRAKKRTSAAPPHRRHA